MPRRNVHPSVWGRPAWDFLHNCAKACDSSSAPYYEAFMRLLPKVLPCEKCRAHAEAWVQANPPDTDHLEQAAFENHVSRQKQAQTTGPPAPPRCEMPASYGARPEMVVAVLIFVLLLGMAAFQLTSLLRR